MKARDVPIVKENLTFVTYEEERLKALEELRQTEDLTKRFEAVMIVTHLWQAQADQLGDMADKAIAQSSKFDPRFDEWRVFMEAWSADSQTGLQQYADYQHELVDLLGEPEAQRIADENVTPRLQAIFDQARAVLRRRLEELGGAPETPPPPPLASTEPAGGEAIDALGVKTCPDCAEQVKAAARKCRFCGYRFDDQSSEQPQDVQGT